MIYLKPKLKKKLIRRCLRTVSMAGVVLGITFSCQREDEPSVQSEEPVYLTEADTEGMVKLGKRLEDPYTVENMKKAWESLKATNTNGRTAGDEIEIATTHLYIKFKPKTEEELDILKNDSTLILFDYPLDYEIAESGDFYHDPEVPLGQPTYQYATVEADKELPKGVEYEVLAELFIPDEDSDDAVSNGRNIYGGMADALVDEALRITGNLDESEEEDYTNARRSKWRPAGRIQLFDDELERPVGVQGAKVRARRWHIVHEGLTDANVFFSCDGRFKRDANYSIKWERNDYDIRSGTFGQALFNGPKMKGDWNVLIRSGASRMYAIVHQAAHDYYYGNRLGLKSPPRNSFWKTRIKISVWDRRNGDANGRHSKNYRFLGILLRLKIWTNDGTCMDIYGTTIHELAHASHWELRKNNWNDNNTESKVKESWARGVQWALGRLRYPDYEGGPTNRPEYTQVVVDMIDDRAPLDAAGNPVNFNRGSEDLTQDDVTGYTIRQIENVLSSTSTWESWGNNIRNRYSNETEDNLDELFNHWN